MYTRYRLLIMYKFFYLLLFLFFCSIANADSMTKVHNECIQLGFKDSTPELAKCKLELLVLNKKMNLEQKKLQASEAQAKAAEATARATEMNAAAAQSLANSSAWRNNQALMKQGQRMLAGACTLGIDC